MKEFDIKICITKVLAVNTVNERDRFIAGRIEQNFVNVPKGALKVQLVNGEFDASDSILHKLNGLYEARR